ncbi:hypothetical protein DDZ18_02200 [Marinicauda salina]|uniref:Copper chaperone PCu(A)C n=1 Tax=Marinicauda salina TaxID=2135793 RepID=A0A2U2BWT4_9PROT|nr:copper chaperone PCu(A)C [Marinicauda salina]PWE18439.1 hypothetical protein DDZ18_02200 [Marinicauda salina]
MRLTALLPAFALLAACGAPDAAEDETAAGTGSAAEAGAAEARILEMAAARMMLAEHDASHLAIGPWARTPPAGRDMTAAYLVIYAAAPDRLVAATSPEADAIELHVTGMEDGVMRMRPAEDGLAVPADGPLTLEPGGAHLMVFGLADDAAEDGRLALELEFESGAVLEVAAPFATEPPGE